MRRHMTGTIAPSAIWFVSFFARFCFIAVLTGYIFFGLIDGLFGARLVFLQVSFLILELISAILFTWRFFLYGRSDVTN